MTPPSESLLDKLKSLGVQVGARDLPQPAAENPTVGEKRRAFPIETVIHGQDWPTAKGETFLCEQHYPAPYQHGSIDLCASCHLDGLAAWGQASRMNDPRLSNVVFLDTETTGLAGGTGTNAFLVGVGYREGDDFHLVQFFLRDPAQEAALLDGLSRWLMRFDVVVTFNGKTFDVPLLNTRYTLNGLSSPFGSFEHLDLLHLARKLWRDRLASRALGDLEREIVHFNRTGEDIPGWMVPQLYFDYLRSGDARPLAGVFYHNAMDILSLAALFNHMAVLLHAPEQHAPMNGGGAMDLAAIARLYEGLGQYERAAALYEQSLAHGLPEDFFFKTIERYAVMLKRQGAHAEAARLWQRSAERGQLNACIELAKYYEHQQRDYAEALRWTQTAVQCVPQTFRFAYAQRDALNELQLRALRLQKRIKVVQEKGNSNG